jgi:hypothetical protein
MPQNSMTPEESKSAGGPAPADEQADQKASQGAIDGAGGSGSGARRWHRCPCSCIYIPDPGLAERCPMCFWPNERPVVLSDREIVQRPWLPPALAPRKSI